MCLPTPPSLPEAWLFIVFRLVVTLLLVVQGSKGFLPTPPSLRELKLSLFYPVIIGADDLMSWLPSHLESHILS